MRQLTFLEPGQLEWRDATAPKLCAATDAIVRPLAAHRLIASSGPCAANEWRLEGRQVAPARMRLTLSTVDAAIAAAEAGVGLANFLDYQVEDALDAGRLIEVLKPAVPQPLPVSLLFEASRANAPSTRAFVDAMRERARQCRWGRI